MRCSVLGDDQKESTVEVLQGCYKHWLRCSGQNPADIVAKLWAVKRDKRCLIASTKWFKIELCVPPNKNLLSIYWLLYGAVSGFSLHKAGFLNPKPGQRHKLASWQTMANRWLISYHFCPVKVWRYVWTNTYSSGK